VDEKYIMLFGISLSRTLNRSFYELSTTGHIDVEHVGVIKCKRCGKIRSLPIFNEKEVEGEIKRENKEIEEENRMIYDGKESSK